MWIFSFINVFFQVFDDYTKLEKVLAAFYEGVRMFRKSLFFFFFVYSIITFLPTMPRQLALLIIGKCGFGFSFNWLEPPRSADGKDRKSVV